MTSVGYDPAHRRETPLAVRIRDLIRTRGPLPVEHYIETCLTDPEYGYYRWRQAIGAAADFVTAPEISQAFGELIGLWSAVVWQRMGQPSRVTLLEIGPGRGTMMADALRAAERVPGFLDAVRVVLAEPSEALRVIQAATLAACPKVVRYLDPGAPLPDGPLIVLANEMLDCVPVGQIVKVAADWRQRVVVVDTAGRLQFGIEDRGALPVHLEHGSAMTSTPPGPQSLKASRGPPPLVGGSRGNAPRSLPAAPAGSIVEHRELHELSRDLARAASSAPFAALFIDYGHDESGVGDTLQAVREHRPEHPLTSPGEADLTAQVDFAAFAATVREEADRAGAALAIDGPVTQAEFLGRLGIIERASRLMAANPAQAGTIEAGVARLLSPVGMGTRFKAIGIHSATLPTLPGFEGASP